MTQETTTEVIAEPFAERDRFGFHVDGEPYTVEVGQEIPYAKTTYVNTRYPAEIVRVYMDPRGVRGGKYERRDGHLCIPTIEVEMQIPDDAEHAHLDGRRVRWECYNAPYTLALREDLPAEDFGMIDCYLPLPEGDA